MHPSELLQLLPRLAESSQDVAVQVQFVYAALVGVRSVEHLVRPGRNADRPGGADVGESLQELAVTVEDLNAVVFAVADIDGAVGVGGNGVYGVELARLSAPL